VKDLSFKMPFWKLVIRIHFIGIIPIFLPHKVVHIKLSLRKYRSLLSLDLLAKIKYRKCRLSKTLHIHLKINYLKKLGFFSCLLLIIYSLFNFFLFVLSFLRYSHAMLPRLASNPWAQAILLLQPP
jgi:hypothetical protein